MYPTPATVHCHAGFSCRRTWYTPREHHARVGLFFRLLALYCDCCCTRQPPRTASCVSSFALNAQLRSTQYPRQAAGPRASLSSSAVADRIMGYFRAAPAVADSRFGKDVASALDRAGQRGGGAGKEAEFVEGDEEDEEGSGEGDDTSFALSDLEDVIEERHRPSWQKIGLKRRYTTSPVAHRRWATLFHSTRFALQVKARQSVEEDCRVGVAPPRLAEIVPQGRRDQTQLLSSQTCLREASPWLPFGRKLLMPTKLAVVFYRRTRPAVAEDLSPCNVLLVCRELVAEKSTRMCCYRRKQPPRRRSW